MIIVADTSPIRYLVELEQVELLPRLFGAVLIPQAVFNELTDDEAPEKVRSFLQKTPDWLQICKPGPDISRVRQKPGTW